MSSNCVHSNRMKIGLERNCSHAKALEQFCSLLENVIHEFVRSWLKHSLIEPTKTSEERKFDFRSQTVSFLEQSWTLVQFSLSSQLLSFHLFCLAWQIFYTRLSIYSPWKLVATHDIRLREHHIDVNVCIESLKSVAKLEQFYHSSYIKRVSEQETVSQILDTFIAWFGIWNNRNFHLCMTRTMCCRVYIRNHIYLLGFIHIVRDSCTCKNRAQTSTDYIRYMNENKKLNTQYFLLSLFRTWLTTSTFSFEQFKHTV